VRSFAAAAAASNSPVTLPDLPYGYGELEPVIAGGACLFAYVCAGLSERRRTKSQHHYSFPSFSPDDRDHGAAPQEAPPGLRDQL
jgi:hypothetical protein